MPIFRFGTVEPSYTWYHETRLWQMAALAVFLLAVLCTIVHAAPPSGGAQGYVEAVKAHHLARGAVAHPRRGDRPEVQTGMGASGFRVLTSNASEPFTHFFENSVGSGHMSLTLRADWRQHLAMARRDLGVRHIRGHGLLDDDMSVSYASGLSAFYNVDSLVDYLVSLGMRPIFELSFMPTWLTSGTM